jgi:hypothetical protein
MLAQSDGRDICSRPSIVTRLFPKLEEVFISIPVKQTAQLEYEVQVMLFDSANGSDRPLRVYLVGFSHLSDLQCPYCRMEKTGVLQGLRFNIVSFQRQYGTWLEI